MDSIILPHDTFLYGKSYLIERVLERPFFLGENGITGEPVEGEPWILSSNPIYCDLKNTTLEQQVIFMIHCRYYSLRNSENIESLFERQVTVHSELINRIAEEIVPETMLDVDNIMSAYNLIVLMYSSMLLLDTSTISSSNSYLNNLSNLKEKLKNDRNLPQRPKAIHAIIAICHTAEWHFHNVFHEISHNKLELENAILPKPRCKIENNSNVHEHEDPFYCAVAKVKIDEDYIDFSYKKVKPFIKFSLLAEELSDKELNLKRFENVNETTLMTESNLENFRNLITMLEYREKNPINDEQRRNIRKLPEKIEEMERFKSILHEFLRIFWARRNRKDEGNKYILFSSEETEFTFQFVTQALNSLSILPYHDAEHITLLKKYLIQYATVLNYLRYPEIASSISLRTAAILSYTVQQFILKDKYVLKHSKIRTCNHLRMVTTRITYFLALAANRSVLKHTTMNRVKIQISECKSIHNVSQIPKARRSKWKKVLENNNNAKDCLKVYNKKICPVCYDQLQIEDFCLFICNHAMCSDCTTIFIGNGLERKSCPNCQNPVCEFIPSGQLTKICRYFQNPSAKVYRATFSDVFIGLLKLFEFIWS